MGLARLIWFGPFEMMYTVSIRKKKSKKKKKKKKMLFPYITQSCSVLELLNFFRFQLLLFELQ